MSNKKTEVKKVAPANAAEIIADAKELKAITSLEKELPAFLALKIEDDVHQREIDIALMDIKKGASKIAAALNFIKSAITPAE